MTDILLTVIIILLILLIWIMLYDTNRFVVIHKKYESDKIQKDFRAVILADLHNKSYGKFNASLLEAIRYEKPDFVFVAGDMITATPGHSMERVLHFMKQLTKEYPVFYANGNHEHRLELYPKTYGNMAETLKKAFEEMGLKRLVNDNRLLKEYGVKIYGLQIDKEYYRRFQTISMDKAYLVNTLGKPDARYYNILLAHNPDYFEAYADWGADIVFSGHVHGGVVRMPFWGKGVLSPACKLFPRYDGGEYQIHNSHMLLSRGLGVHTIPIRLFNPGELIVADFSGKRK